MSVYAHGWTASCDERPCRWWAHFDSREKADAAMARHTAHSHPEPPPAESKVEDLMDALTKSVDAAKAARQAAHNTSGPQVNAFDCKDADPTHAASSAAGGTE